MRTLYRERRNVLVEGLHGIGWPVLMPKALMFCWAPIPDEFKHLGSLEFSKWLLARADVAVSPGISFGKYGDGYVRIAVVKNKHLIRQAVRNIKQFFKEYHEEQVLKSAEALEEVR